jgi:WD40 repeat protein
MRVKFSPVGRYIAAGYAVNRIIIWDVEAGNIVYQFTASVSLAYGGVTSVAFSPDGKRLVSADGRYRINIWNLENRSHERQLTGDFRYDELLAVYYYETLNKSGDRIISGSSIRREIII